MSKLKATGFFKPYTPTGNYNLRNTGKGVYIIKKNGKTLYVGLSLSDVQTTLYRHFQKWTDNRSEWTKRTGAPYERVTYYGEKRDLFTVKVIYCQTDKVCRLVEYLLIKKLKPRDNTLKMELYTDSPQEDKVVAMINNAESWKSNNDFEPF